MLIAESTICLESDQARIFCFIFLFPTMCLMCLLYVVLILLSQLSELVNVESYGDWIRLVAEFTLRSLQSWQVNSLITGFKNSIWSLKFYSVFTKLLILLPWSSGLAAAFTTFLGCGLDWFRRFHIWRETLQACLVISCQRLSKVLSHLDLVPFRLHWIDFACEVASRVIIISCGFRFTLCYVLVLQGEVSDLSENPLDNVELLQDQLDCLPNLCRFQVQTLKYDTSKIIKMFWKLLDFLFNFFSSDCSEYVLTVGFWPTEFSKIGFGRYSMKAVAHTLCRLLILCFRCIWYA